MAGASSPQIPLETVAPGRSVALPHTNQQGQKSRSWPGPEVNGRPTTVVVLESAQMKNWEFLDSLLLTANEAYTMAHAAEAGDAPGTFAVMLYGHNTGEVIGCCGAKLYLGPPKINAGFDSPQKQTFKRKAASEPGKEQWELIITAVNVKAQKQGIAGFLPKTTEDEVRHRYLQRSEKTESGELKQLWVILTTLKEANWAFYTKRGFKTDSEDKHEPGYLRSEAGFSVAHMSKQLTV